MLIVDDVMFFLSLHFKSIEFSSVESLVLGKTLHRVEFIEHCT